MARYIDADKFMELSQDFSTFDYETKSFGCFSGVSDEDIAKIPTADVVETKHGKWLPVQYTYFGLKRYECSECKDDEYWQKRYLEHKEKYCPNCGAKMDGTPKERGGEK